MDLNPEFHPASEVTKHVMRGFGVSLGVAAAAQAALAAMLISLLYTWLHKEDGPPVCDWRGGAAADFERHLLREESVGADRGHMGMVAVRDVSRRARFLKIPRRCIITDEPENATAVGRLLGSVDFRALVSGQLQV